MKRAASKNSKKLALPYRWLVVEVSESCNHACVHCYNENTAWLKGDVRDPILSADEIRAAVRAVREQSPIEQVALSGGEPLLRDDTPEIARALVEDGLNVVVISNLSRLDDSMAARFPAGTVFEFTLFSVEPALHDRIAGRPGAYERALQGALAAHKAGHGLALSVVISSHNAHAVTPVIKLGLAMGAQAILLNRVNLTRPLLRDNGAQVPTKEQLRRVFDEADALAGECRMAFGVAIPVPPCVMDIGRYQNLHFGFCPRGSADAYYTVGTRGDVRPCNHSSKVLGNLRRQSFAEIVGSQGARDFWSCVPPVCAACTLPMADECQGGCLAAADECVGHRTDPDPFVDLALRPE